MNNNFRIFLTATALLFQALFSTAQAASAKSLCIFDVGGTLGQVYMNAREYALQVGKMGIVLEPRVYRNEDDAYRDFVNNKCDAAVLTGMRARLLNNFTGSIDTIGAVPTLATAKRLIYQANSSQYQRRMSTPNGYEVVGVAPMGAYYLFVADRNTNNIARLVGKRMGVMPYDKSQFRLVTRMGALPIPGSPQQIAQQFNEGKLDVIPLPAMAYGPLQLEQGMKKNGGVIQFPLGYLTMSFLIHQDAFPPNFGQKSRALFKDRLLENIFQQVAVGEQQIPPKYWIPLPSNEKDSYAKLMKEARMSLTREGFFNPEMMSLAKKVRCQAAPSSYECTIKDE